MKYFLIAVIVFGVSYVGYGISKFYRKRKRYFEDLILMTERLSVDISFSKDNLQKILNNSLDSFGIDLKNSVTGYIDFLKRDCELNNDLLFKKGTLIREEEKETILLFFKGLGRLDASNQVAEISNFKERFLSFKQSAENENKKFGSLSFKLAFLFALLLIILLI